MKQLNPFPEVSSRYGAPMGRRSDNPANLQDVKRLHARHQGGVDLIREKLEELENYKEFFHDCFSRLAGHYPCPSVTSDHDKGVIFSAIDKGEGTQDV